MCGGLTGRIREQNDTLKGDQYYRGSDFYVAEWLVFWLSVTEVMGLIPLDSQFQKVLIRHF